MRTTIKPTRLRTLITTTLAGLSLLTAAAIAQPANNKEKNNNNNNAPQPRRTVLLSFETAPIETFLVDAKDANLRAALLMLPKRFAELRTEIEGADEIPKELISVIEKIMGKGARFSLELDPVNNAQSRFGVHTCISLGFPNEADARAVGKDIDTLWKDAAGPNPPRTSISKSIPTMQELATPAGLLRFGPRSTPTGWRYEVHFGSPKLDDLFASMQSTTLAGVKITPISRSSFDPAALEPLMTMFAAANPAGGMVAAQLADAGYFGENAISISNTTGFTESSSLSVTRIENARIHAEALGISETPLTAAQLRIIPADAKFGSISSFSLASTINQITRVEESLPPEANFFEMLRARVGVDIVTDLLNHLGTTGGHYVSDSTGGGGLMSLVAFTSVNDSTKLSATLDKLAGSLNSSIDGFTQAQLGKKLRYLTINRSNYRNQKLYSLQFRGLPIPLELSLGLTDQWLFITLSPQACMAAIDQATSSDPGFTTNPAFVSAIPTNRPLVRVAFNDVSRTIRDGYPALTLIGTAITNTVRSPSTDRDPGQVVPTYNQLMKGARATVSITTFDKDAYVTETTADRSTLVNAAASIGELSTYTPILASIGLRPPAGASSEQPPRANPRPPPPRPA
ncbi:MAG: hypothetical protein IBJ18_00005, partial [Phycisphaerales bacterium]|nr:hypothetical protein [Phycisphaerales bacterium]